MWSTCGERPDRARRRPKMTRNVHTVAQENVSATLTVAVPAARVFAVLADPTSHASIDGTGWVRQAVDQAPLTEVGQVFRMAMYHADHPDGDYKVANQVQVFDPPRAIGWMTGGGEGRRSPGVRRLDLALRPRAARPVRNRDHAHLRLVGGTAVHQGVHPVPAVRPRPSHRLAAPPGRARLEVTAAGLMAPRPAALRRGHRRPRAWRRSARRPTTPRYAGRCPARAPSSRRR